MKRYDPKQWAMMTECADGDYVEYSDAIDAIQKTRQEAARECIRLVDMFIGTEDITVLIKRQFKLEG